MNETVFQMPGMNLRLLLAACVAWISFACADSGTVPEPEPEPAPVPVPVPEETEPYLEVSPALLRFDVAGNALGEKSFVVKTNCPWRLDIPKEADWLEASDVAGKGLDTVSFRLFIDRTYHTADLVFTAECADGHPALTQSVTVRQGTEPVEPDPSDPDTPDDNPPGLSNPDDPGGDSGGGSGTPSDDNDSGGENTPPTGNDSNDTERGGGSDDFTHLKPESLFKNRVGPTPAGWCGEYCAVYSGGGYDSDPTYPSLLGTRANVKGLAMNGKTTAVGRIVSPEIAGGCGTLSFDYGITDAGDRRVDFTVEILQNGVSVRTFRVERTAEKFMKYTFAEDVRVSGRFQIVFTNNCPSKQARDQDRYTIFHIEWTGLKQTENDR